MGLATQEVFGFLPMCLARSSCKALSSLLSLSTVTLASSTALKFCLRASADFRFSPFARAVFWIMFCCSMNFFLALMKEAKHIWMRSYRLIEFSSLNFLLFQFLITMAIKSTAKSWFHCFRRETFQNSVQARIFGSRIGKMDESRPSLDFSEKWTELHPWAWLFEIVTYNILVNSKSPQFTRHHPMSM